MLAVAVLHEIQYSISTFGWNFHTNASTWPTTHVLVKRIIVQFTRYCFQHRLILIGTQNNFHLCIHLFYSAIGAKRQRTYRISRTSRCGPASTPWFHWKNKHRTHFASYLWTIWRNLPLSWGKSKIQVVVVAVLVQHRMCVLYFSLKTTSISAMSLNSRIRSQIIGSANGFLSMSMDLFIRFPTKVLACCSTTV